MRALISNPDGNLEVVEIRQALDQYQELVGGYIEQLTLQNNCVAIFGEDARITGSPQNSKANYIIQQETGQNYDIVGSVLFLGFDQDTSDYIETPEHFIERYAK